MPDRFTWYACAVVAVVMLPVTARLDLAVVEYRMAETRYDCMFNYYKIVEVYRLHSASNCAEFIDEYRFIETAGAGFQWELVDYCRGLATDPRRLRDIVCAHPLESVVVPPVSYFAHRGRTADDPLFYPMVPTL